LLRDAAFWYASIFCWLFFTGIGVPPCPEEAGIFWAAGVTAVQPAVRWWIAWPLTIAGILCADAVLYGMGRFWGPRLFEYRWVRKIVKPERRRRLERRFHEHGLKILLTARLLPPLRTGVFVLAGAIHYPFTRFLLADMAYGLVGVGVLFFGGAGVIQLIHRLGAHWVVYVLALVAGGYLLYRYYHHLRQRELTGDAEPPVSALEIPEGPAVPPAPPDGPHEAVPPRESISGPR
jgi:membrane protein DedA with SNARE-associated domain